MAATAHKHAEIGAIDPIKLTFTTKPRWYAADGSHITTPTCETISEWNVCGKFLVTFVVELVSTDRDHVAVVVTPRAFRFGWQPPPNAVSFDSPEFPDFLRNRADALALAIHSDEIEYAGP
jgi:hypothetical protein